MEEKIITFEDIEYKVILQPIYTRFIEYPESTCRVLGFCPIIKTIYQRVGEKPTCGYSVPAKKRVIWDIPMYKVIAIGYNTLIDENYKEKHPNYVRERIISQKVRDKFLGKKIVLEELYQTTL